MTTLPIDISLPVPVMESGFVPDPDGATLPDTVLAPRRPPPSGYIGG